MPTYSADDIIGKSLFAKKVVNLRKFASTEAPILAKTTPGDLVGVVYSYIKNPEGVWWQIKEDGKSFWAFHGPGYFDVQAIKDQGVKTTQQKIKEEQEANMSFGDKALNLLKKAGIITAAIVGAKTVYDIYKSKK